MEIEIFSLCDAVTESMGKLNILGTFDRIIAQQLPIIHPHCAIALRIRFERIEEGEHLVRINLVDGDGQALFPSLDGKINVQMQPEGHWVCVNLILQLNGLKFQKAGQYSIDLAIDGRHEKSLPILIALIKPKALKP